MKKFAKFLGSMAVLSLLAACSSTDGGSSSATQPQKRPTNPSTIGGSGGDGSTGSGKPGAPMEAFFGTTATIKAEADAENEKRIKDSITAYNNANPGSKVNLGTNDWKDIASDALSQANPTAYITSRLAEIGTMQSAYTAYQTCAADGTCIPTGTPGSQKDALVSALDALYGGGNTITDVPLGTQIFNVFETERRVLAALQATPPAYIPDVTIGNGSRAGVQTQLGIDINAELASAGLANDENAAYASDALNKKAADSGYITTLVGNIASLDSAKTAYDTAASTFDQTKLAQNYDFLKYNYDTALAACGNPCTTATPALNAASTALYGVTWTTTIETTPATWNTTSPAYLVKEKQDALDAAKTTLGTAVDAVEQAAGRCSATPCITGVPDAAYFADIARENNILTAISGITPAAGQTGKNISYYYDSAAGVYYMKLVDKNRTEADPENPGQTRNKTITLKAGDLKSIDSAKYYMASAAGPSNVSDVAGKTYLPTLKSYVYAATETDVPNRVKYVKDLLNRLLNPYAATAEGSAQAAADIAFFNSVIGSGLFGPTSRTVGATVSLEPKKSTDPSSICATEPAKCQNVVKFADTTGSGINVTADAITARIRTLLVGQILSNSTNPVFDIQKKVTTTDTVKTGGGAANLKLKYADFGIWTVNTKTTYTGGTGDKLLDAALGLADASTKNSDAYSDTPFFSGIDALRQPYDRDVALSGGAKVYFTGNVLAVATKQGSGATADVRQDLFGSATLEVDNDAKSGKLTLAFTNWYNFIFGKNTGIDLTSQDGFQSSDLAIERNSNKEPANGIVFANLSTNSIAGSTTGQLYGIESGRPTEGAGIFHVETADPNDIYDNAGSNYAGITVDGAYGVKK